MGSEMCIRDRFVAVDDEVCPNFFAESVAKLVHLFKFVAGIYMQKRKWKLARVKSFLSKTHHHGGVFAHRVEHHRALELRDDLSKNVDSLGLELI